ncbi:MAG TPA: heparinase II/III family protein [Caldilineaceae bacterium]|nr:heparinase II/III family protein [Caldilineaceae bacterium]
MLSQRYSREQLHSLLLPPKDWWPYPTIRDRAPWEALPAILRRHAIAEAEATIGDAWPALPATLFLQFARNGNRRNYEIPHFERRGRLNDLVIAECIENQGRFLDEVVNGIWAICEESFWGVPAHIGAQASGKGLPDPKEVIVDLFVAETAALLAWTDYLLGVRLDDVAPMVRWRIADEIQTRLITPCLERDDYNWMGFLPRPDGRPVNNWNPWICSNWLASVLLLEKDRQRREQSVYKILRALDNFIDPYPSDGGCDEGPSYWGRAGASLFDNLELLYSASNGQIDVYHESLIQEIGRFIHRVQIADDYYINFADAPALVYPDAMLVYRYGLRIDDVAMMQLGVWLAARQEIQSGGSDEQAERKSGTYKKRNVPTSMGRRLPALFSLNTLPPEPATPPLPRDVYLDAIEVMVARDHLGSTAGFFVAAKGGHNAESHNHNDIGNFIVYIDGKPLIVDAGVETYTAKTFSAQRYEIWTMQSAYHSLLPTIDGVQQLPGRPYQATNVIYEANDQQVTFALDIDAAYPDEAQIDQWRRTVTFHRGKAVVITDDYALAEAPGEITLSIVTPAAVDLRNSGEILFVERPILGERVAATGKLHYDSGLFTVTTETIPITDERLGGTWGDLLTRVIFRANQPPSRGEWQFRITR